MKYLLLLLLIRPIYCIVKVCYQQYKSAEWEWRNMLRAFALPFYWLTWLTGTDDYFAKRWSDPGDGIPNLVVFSISLIINAVIVVSLLELLFR